MTTRIVVTGPECTGKTTLAAVLARELAVPWVPEASRRYAEDRLRAGRTLGPADVEPIARAHIAAEDRALEGRPTTLVLDTDLISTVAYARHYYHRCPEWIEAEARRRVGDLYLLCAPDIPWVPDGVRDRPMQRDELLAHFSSVLNEFSVPVLGVSGVDPQRTGAAVAAARRVAEAGT